MKKCSLLLIYAFIAMAFSQSHSTQELSLTIKVRNPEILFKEPVSMEIILRNEGKIPLKLPFEPDGDVLGPWSSKPSVLISTEDKRDVFCIQDSRTMKANFDPVLEDGGYITPPGGTFTFEVKMMLPREYSDKAGKIEIYGRYVSKGKHLGQLGAAVGKNGEIVEPAKYHCEGCWEGSVESVPVPLNISMPTGVDLEAYDYLKGEPLSNPTLLLQRFPTSTYAGYELCKGGPSLRRAAEIDDAKRDMDWFVTPLASPDEKSKRREMVRQGWTEKADRIIAFLKIHPDFAKADLLRRSLASYLFYLDRRSEAIEQLEILSKMEGQNAEDAREVLGCVEGNKKIEAAPVKKSAPEIKEER